VNAAVIFVVLACGSDRCLFRRGANYVEAINSL
jgi:hypothetical protein